jgi:hypothetical protein
MQRASRSWQQEKQQEQVQPWARPHSRREGCEGVDCRDTPDNSEGLSHPIGAVHTPNARDYGRPGQPTEANDGVARLPTQPNYLLNRRDLAIFGRDWDCEANNQDSNSSVELENEENDGGGKQPALGNRPPRRPTRPRPLQSYNQMPAAPSPSPVMTTPPPAIGQLDSIANLSGYTDGILWTAGEQGETQPEKKKRKQNIGRRKLYSYKKRKGGKGVRKGTVIEAAWKHRGNKHGSGKTVKVCRGLLAAAGQNYEQLACSIFGDTTIE